jgi:hypothetical protein
MKIHLWLFNIFIIIQACVPSSTTSNSVSSNSNGTSVGNTSAINSNPIYATPSPTTNPIQTVTVNEIMDVPQIPSVTAVELTTLKKKTGNANGKVIIFPEGYIAIGCDNWSNFNFCLTVYDKNMNVVRVISNGPKIPNNVYQTDYTVVADIAYAQTGHIILAGFTSQPLGEMPADTGGPLTARGDGFVAKYKISGEYVWLKHFGAQTKGSQAAMREEFHSVEVNKAGEIIVAGTTASNFAETHAGRSDALLLKLSTTGQIVFQKQLGSGTYGALASMEEKFLDLVVDGDDNIYVGGHTHGNLLETNSDSPNCGFPGAANGDCDWSDIIIFSYSNSGSLRWARQLGKVSATGLNAASPKFDYLSQLVLGNDGAIYFTGTREVNNDITVGKINSNGTLAWYRKYLGSNAQKADNGVSLFSDTVNDNIYVCSTTLGNLYEAQGGGAVSVGVTSVGNGDIALLKITSSTGTLGAIRHFGNVSLGPDKAGLRESCGSIYKEGDFITLFGTTESNLFPGAGKQFIARDLLENYFQLLMN